LYIWVLYVFLPPKWHWWDDFKALVTGRVGRQPMPRPRARMLLVLFAGKILFLGWALVLPMLLHPVVNVLLIYAFVSLVTGVTLGTVFQLAHCVEEAEITPLPATNERMPRSWAEHQLATTTNFCPRNRILSWYLGGLNYQVEHHLFPRISHVHYPALSPIVREVCAESGIQHMSHDNLGRALLSHIRFLKRLGRP